jgi:hypothetical protein
MNAEIQTILFYGWWQFAVCLFAFCALMAIWWHIGKIQGDMGQVWLALSILCWSLSGVMEVVYAQSGFDTDNSIWVQGTRSIFSLFNSLFILLALPWFRYLPERIEHIVKSNFWMYIIGLPFLFSFLATIGKIISGRNNAFISELDVCYAILTLGFLGIVLWETFSKRRLFGLALLSVACILITLIAQILKFSGSNVNMLLFSAIFKTTLIMIFFALALSWVRELSENIFPAPSKLFMNLNKKKNEGKFQFIAEIDGLLDGQIRTIRLSQNSFWLLEKFVEKIKNDPKNGWLEIKPKGEARPDKSYDINDYNELKRLIENLLNGIFGKNLWTRDSHETALRDSLFKMSPNRERKVKLRIPVANIRQN